MKLLHASNVPLLFGEERQQSRPGGSDFLPAANFTPKEALAPIVLCHDLGEGFGLPFRQSAWNAALKPESTLPGGSEK
jgi:hypothetical protein